MENNIYNYGKNGLYVETRPEIGDEFVCDETGLIFQVISRDDDQITFIPSQSRHNEKIYSVDEIEDFFTKR